MERPGRLAPAGVLRPWWAIADAAEFVADVVEGLFDAEDFGGELADGVGVLEAVGAEFGESSLDAQVRDGVTWVSFAFHRFGLPRG